MKRIRETTIEYVFKVQINVTARPMPSGQENKKSDPTKSSPDNNNRNEKKQVTTKDIKKIGRNDPCPCGSGKKYKKCCGANK